MSCSCKITSQLNQAIASCHRPIIRVANCLSWTITIGGYSDCTVNQMRRSYWQEMLYLGRNSY